MVTTRRPSRNRKASFGLPCTSIWLLTLPVRLARRPQCLHRANLLVGHRQFDDALLERTAGPAAATELDSDLGRTDHGDTQRQQRESDQDTGHAGIVP